MEEAEKVADEILAALPELTEIVSDHRRANGGVLLHVLFSELAEYTETLVSQRRIEPLRRIVGYLDARFALGPELVRNAVALSYLLGMSRSVTKHFGPHLLAEWERLERWRPAK